MPSPAGPDPTGTSSASPCTQTRETGDSAARSSPTRSGGCGGAPSTARWSTRSSTTPPPSRCTNRAASGASPSGCASSGGRFETRRGRRAGGRQPLRARRAARRRRRRPAAHDGGRQPERTPPRAHRTAGLGHRRRKPPAAPPGSGPGGGCRRPDGTRLAGFVTPVVAVAPGANGGPAIGQRLGVSWVVPMTAPPAYTADGKPDPYVVSQLRPEGRLGRRAIAIANSGVPLTLAPGPETLESWTQLAN